MIISNKEAELYSISKYIDKCIKIVERHKENNLIVETILRELKEFKRNEIKKSIS